MGQGDQAGTTHPPHSGSRCIHGAIVCRRGGDYFGQVGGSRRDVLGKPEEVFELVVDFLGNFDPFGMRSQGMLEEREAATTPWDSEAHAS